MDKLQLIKGFLWIRYDVFDNDNLNGSDIMVYAVLMRYMNNETKRCFPSIPTIALQARLHKDTVIESLKKLEEERLICVTRDDGKVNHYLLLEPTSRNFPTGRKKELNQSESGKVTILTDNTKKTYVATNEQEEIIAHLNKKLGLVSPKGFKDTNQQTLKLLNARLKDYTKKDIIAVIDMMCNKRIGTEWQMYLRPITLFNTNKFEGYINSITLEGSESREHVVMPLQDLE